MPSAWALAGIAARPPRPIIAESTAVLSILNILVSSFAGLSASLAEAMRQDCALQAERPWNQPFIFHSSDKSLIIIEIKRVQREPPAHGSCSSTWSK